MEETVRTLEGMQNTARRILTQVVNSKQSDQATVLGLQGELGAGKTAFTKQLAALLGIRKAVKSPTFVLQIVYDIPEEKQKETGFCKLVHIDAYRMENDSELEHLKWSETITDPHNLVIVEWPERVAERLPKNTKHIGFTFVDETTRNISW